VLNQLIAAEREREIKKGRDKNKMREKEIRVGDKGEKEK
jgi:hypothetical protein